MNADEMLEILDFFKEEHDFDLETIKLDMYRCLQEYRERVTEAYSVRISDLSLEQQPEIEPNNTSEFENEFDTICEDVLNEVLSKYDNIDIDLNDNDITVTAITNYFVVTCQMSVCEANSKMSDLFFEVDLSNNSLFLINLCNKLISMAEERKKEEGEYKNGK